MHIRSSKFAFMLYYRKLKEHWVLQQSEISQVILALSRNRNKASFSRKKI